MPKILRSIGPAIIVAAVVLGPGSILTSSRVGANFGLAGLPFVALASILMMAMVGISAQIGIGLAGSPCQEIANRLGRGWAVFIGAVLFCIAAFFQSSNNLALLGGLESLIYAQGKSFSFPVGSLILVAVNLALIALLYGVRHLYKHVESGMKILVGLMVVAFLVNFVAILLMPDKTPAVTATAPSYDLLPLLALMGTTYVTAAAFYQAYLVKEKNWSLSDLKRSRADSIISISVLGLITMVILASSWRVFHGTPQAATLGSIADVARQLEPVFGKWARIIFSLGILAAALSSFLVNSMIGGTVLSDGLGKGSRLSDAWPLHLTSVALIVGMTLAILSKAGQSAGTVHLITFAQALTVVGAPALAIAIIYLATRREMSGDLKLAPWLLSIGIFGILVSCVLSALTVRNIASKFAPSPEKSAPAAR